MFRPMMSCRTRCLTWCTAPALRGCRESNFLISARGSGRPHALTPSFSGSGRGFPGPEV
jgi:hypothetical protein